MLTRVLLCCTIMALMVTGTAGRVLADSQYPETARERSVALPTPTPRPTPTPWPTPTPLPTVACPVPLSMTLEVTYSSFYYDTVSQTSSLVEPALTSLSSTVSDMKSGLTDLREFLGLSSMGGDAPSGSGPYDDQTLAQMTTEVISNTSITMAWFRAIGDLSVTGIAVDFLLLSLAFILFVVLLKASIKLTVWLIQVIVQVAGAILELIPL